MPEIEFPDRLTEFTVSDTVFVGWGGGVVDASVVALAVLDDKLVPTELIADTSYM